MDEAQAVSLRFKIGILKDLGKQELLTQAQVESAIAVILKKEDTAAQIPTHTATFIPS